MFDIFGKPTGDVLEGGLIDCTSPEEFDKALDTITTKWKNMHRNGHKFVDYFMKEKADVIRETARSDIRSMCGLGFPPKVYTQNANECLNRLIKAEQNSAFSKKEAALSSYVERIRTEIDRQQNEQFLAVIGKGPYRLSEQFSFLAVKDTDFYRTTDNQKKILRNTFFTMSLSEAKGLYDVEGGSTVKELSVTAENK